MSASTIEYCLRTCAAGRLLVAATGRGVCFVDFPEADASPRDLLVREFPFALPGLACNGSVSAWADRIAGAADGGPDATGVPLDVRGSQFQRRVWNALRRIPSGETRTYSEIAVRIGSPCAARAVARACAANPTPVVTPCHRVIEKSGALGGFAYGPQRKRRLLELEGALQAPSRMISAH